MSGAPRPRLHALACLTAGSAFLLLIAGGLVTSTGSSLAVPDWPLSFGKLFPAMIGGVLYEHGHRLIAGAVSLLTFALAAVLRLTEPRAWVRRLAYLACAAILAQAALGGLTVLLRLPPAVSISHACLGQAVFCLLLTLAQATSPGFQRPWTDSRLPAGFWKAGALAVAAVYLQLILGALLRHTGSGLLLHACWATAATAALARLIYKGFASKNPALHGPAGLLAAALPAQLLLGYAAYRLTFSPDYGRGPHREAALVTAHVALGALILGAALVWTLRAFRLRADAKASTPVSESPPSAIQDYLALAKPRIALMVMAFTALGYLLSGARAEARLLWTVLGAGLASAACGALNQLLEREQDACMRRTRLRPLPTGRLRPGQALVFGLAALALGLGLLHWKAGPLPLLITALTTTAYILGYTPLKQITPHSTWIGAAAGAAPPLVGWAAAQGTLEPRAWILFAIQFLWQIPHFLAMFWMHRLDYAKAGFRVMPAIDPDGRLTAAQIALHSFTVLPASLLPSLCGMAGLGYGVGALALSATYLGVGLKASWTMAAADTRRLFVASLAYLPILFAMLWLGGVR